MASKVNRNELWRLARLGAEARLEALEKERQALLSSFPGIQRGTTGRTGRTNDGGGRRYGGMSAAQRKAVSARMTKYWAERRKAKSR